VVLIELFVILYLFSILQKMLIALGYKDAKESKWTLSAIYKRMTKSIPIEKESDVATDHEYDGIRELDNSLPPWWVYMFYATIVFSIIYVIYFHWAGGPTQKMEYDRSIELAQAQKTEMLKKNAANVDENSVVVLTDAAEIAKGKSSFVTKCAACHGQAGEGGVHVQRECEREQQHQFEREQQSQSASVARTDAQRRARERACSDAVGDQTTGALSYSYTAVRSKRVSSASFSICGSISSTKHGNANKSDFSLTASLAVVMRLLAPARRAAPISESTSVWE
jgi:hypothetical protein